MGIAALTLNATALQMKAPVGAPTGFQKAAVKSSVVAEANTFAPKAIQAPARNVEKIGDFSMESSMQKAPRKAAEDVITEQPAGELKKYVRSGSYLYYNNGYYIGSSSGFADIVFDEDGETVYIKDIIGAFGFGTWVKGTIETVTTPRSSYDVVKVPTGQVLYNHANYGDFKLCVYDWYNDTIKSDVSELLYRISGNTLTLQTYTSYAVQVSAEFEYNGKAYTADALGLPSGEYATVFTLFEEPETTEVPAGLEFTEYPFSATKNASAEYSATVGVAWDANDVYIKGIVPELPDAVFKGTLADNDTITFEVQYLGKDDDYPYYIGGYSSLGGVPSFYAYYDADDDIINFTGSVMILCSPTDGSARVYFYNGGIIGTAPEATELPEGLEYETLPYVTNQYDFDAGSFDYLVTKIDVAFDDANNKIYLRGLLTDCVQGWLVGTIDGTTVTFEPQYAGKNTRYGSGNYFVGYNTSEGSVQSMTFTYDAANKFMYSRQYFGALDNIKTINGWYDLYAYAYIGAYDDDVEAISADGEEYYATYVDDTYNRVVDENTTIYAATLSETKDYLDLVEVEGKVIPAGTAVILKTNAASLSLPATVEDGAEIGANDLTFNDEAIDADSIANAPLFLIGIDNDANKVALLLNDSEPVDALTVNIPVSAAAEGASVLPFGKPESVLLGDVNKDGSVDISDVVALADYVSGAGGDINLDAADYNGQDGVDVADVVALANAVMGS